MGALGVQTMRVVWLNLSEGLNPSKLAGAGATGVAFDIRDPRLNLNFLRGIRDGELAPYVYTTPHWPETEKLNGAEFAVWTHALLNVIAPRTGAAMPAVCFDIEHHDAAFVRSCFDRWRELRPTRVTDWTLESFQFGWEDSERFHLGWAASLTEDFARWNILVAPQFYKGDMTPFAADRAILNAIKGGVPADRLIGCYDAARLFDGWSGYGFTQGRIL